MTSVSRGLRFGACAHDLAQGLRRRAMRDFEQLLPAPSGKSSWGRMYFFIDRQNLRTHNYAVERIKAAGRVWESKNDSGKDRSSS